MSKRSISVRIAGHEYRIKSDEDEAHLHEVARYVEDTMDRIRQRTGAVDSLEVALLASLNLARDLLDAREVGNAAPPPSELRGLIERVELALDESASSS
ncbi:MAG: cell division protein ZapA [Myxococcota bacterium]|nr:cell division protein ZapA [Myxococcota bacterium]